MIISDEEHVNSSGSLQNEEFMKAASLYRLAEGRDAPTCFTGREEWTEHWEGCVHPLVFDKKRDF